MNKANYHAKYAAERRYIHNEENKKSGYRKERRKYPLKSLGGKTKKKRLYKSYHNSSKRQIDNQKRKAEDV